MSRRRAARVRAPGARVRVPAERPPAAVPPPGRSTLPTLLWLLTLVGALVPARAAQSQARPASGAARLRPELRVEGVAGPWRAALGGAGLFGDAGAYARVGLVAALGVGRDPTVPDAAAGDRAGPAARVEAVARFHLDPWRLSRRGLYLGGGAGVDLRDGAGPRWGLAALVGVEGAPRGTLAPAVEVGLGGGLRVAVALRRTRADRR